MSTIDTCWSRSALADTHTIRVRLRGAVWAFLLLGIAALLAWLTETDRAVFEYLAASPGAQTLRPLGKAYSDGAPFLFYMPFAALLALGLRRRDGQMKAIGQAYLLAQICGTVLLVHLVKLATARPRPLPTPVHDAFFQIHDFAAALHSSFPSSHAVDVMVGAAFVTLLARSRTAVLLAATAAVLMAAARVLIGKHYLSDVLAGLALGAAITTVVVRAFLLPRLYATRSASPR
jgi:membrane-associated phospholipid phosphatase